MGENANYRICSRCIMDTSDPAIYFDAAGVCSNCHAFDELRARRHMPDDRGERIINTFVENAKRDGRGKDYDCVVGVSGGVDSSYVLYRTKQLGLRPLAVHFDCGWDSELAVKNIENLVKLLDVDLFTWVVDWEEMRDLQVAFFRSGVSNADIPTDHALVASLYAVSARHGVRWIVSGSNVVTESLIPSSWGYSSSDLRHLRAIQGRFGTMKLSRYPQMGFTKRYLWYRFVHQIRMFRLLDYLPYVKADVMEFLKKDLGWRDYGGKHHESRFTRFYQTYYLPTRFGFDKRRAHLSNLVVSGQMTRDEALREMDEPAIAPNEVAELKEYVLKKLGLSDAEFAQIMAEPIRRSEDFPNNQWLYGIKARIFPKLQALGISP